MQALHSVATLARTANVTRQMLGRLLRANDVRLVYAGRAVFVPLSEIERKIPPLWARFRAAARIRKLAGTGTKAGPEAVRPGPCRPRMPLR
jgi:hypothetical protein